MRRTIICVDRDEKGRIIRVQTRHTDQFQQVQHQTWNAQAIFERQDEIETITDKDGNSVDVGHFDFYAQTTYAKGTLWVRSQQDEDGIFFIRENIGDESHPPVQITAPLCSELDDS